jgi:hypothetical protein
MGPKMIWLFSLVSHFGNVLHLWVLPIVKHEAKVITSLNICKSQSVERRFSFACCHNECCSIFDFKRIFDPSSNFFGFSWSL